MLPVMVSPLHDLDGLTFSHLAAITPQLKNIFAHVFFSVSPPTQQTQAKSVKQLQQDRFFQLNFNQPDTVLGDHFLSAYKSAVAACPPTQVLHLCFIDRVAFALQSEHRDQFVADVGTTGDEQTPVLFQRSTAAWDTHPHNYREIEHIATRVGEMLFDKALDFAWCHLALQARQLKEMLPHVKRRDLGILAEMVCLLKDQVRIKNVDWLAWEDPFIHSHDPEKLKRERENSVQETRKRLAYLIPVMQVLLESTE
jgi:hypothetical protein